MRRPHKATNIECSASLLPYNFDIGRQKCQHHPFISFHFVNGVGGYKRQLIYCIGEPKNNGIPNQHIFQLKEHTLFAGFQRKRFLIHSGILLSIPQIYYTYLTHNKSNASIAHCLSLFLSIAPSLTCSPTIFLPHNNHFLYTNELIT